jgi:hypothetical protein
VIEVPPPGYVPPKRKPRTGGRFSFGEAYRTAAKVAHGYNKAATVQGLAHIAHEIRRLIRG